MIHGPFTGTPGLGRCVLGLLGKNKEASEWAKGNMVSWGQRGSWNQILGSSSAKVKTLSVVLSYGKLLEGFAHCCNMTWFAFLKDHSGCKCGKLTIENKKQNQGDQLEVIAVAQVGDTVARVRGSNEGGAVSPLLANSLRPGLFPVAWLCFTHRLVPFRSLLKYLLLGGFFLVTSSWIWCQIPFSLSLTLPGLFSITVCITPCSWLCWLPFYRLPPAPEGKLRKGKGLNLFFSASRPLCKCLWTE